MRKQWIPIPFLILWLCLCGADALDDKVPKEPKPAPPQNGWSADDLDRKLQVIRVPEVDFFQVPLTDALNSLNKLAAKHDPEAKLNPQFACNKINLEMFPHKRSMSNDKDTIGEQNEVKINCNSIVLLSW